jgi:hypothetical protein
MTMACRAEFEIETTTNAALSEIFRVQQVRSGVQISSPDGEATLTVKDYETSKGFGLGELATLVAEFLKSPAGAFAISLSANWLYDVLKGRARRVKHQGVVYRITKEELQQMLEDITRTHRAQTPLDEPKTPPGDNGSRA